MTSSTNEKAAENEKEIEEKLKRLRQENQKGDDNYYPWHKVEHYISQGLTKSEARSYIESLKTQEKLSKIMSMNDNQRKNGGQNFNFTETSPTSQVLP